LTEVEKHTPADEVLAALAKSGDMAAFEQLVNRYRVIVYRVARSITGSHDDADDAAQETFIRLYRSLERYDSQRPFKPWIRRIAHNTSLNVLRKHKAGGRKVALEDAGQVVNGGPGPQEIAESADSQRHAREAIEALQPDLRTVLLMRSVEGLSYKEIAQMTGVKIGTVMSRLSRARNHILKAMQAEEVLPEGGE
jgi:RNA polymerase sigma-70 factor (ECF subfamily)